MKISGIYKITSPTGKIYIGQSVDIVKRFWDYRSFDCKKQRKLYSSFKKHGVKNHLMEIICQCEPSDLNSLEKFYIEKYNTFNSVHGMNLTGGGDGSGIRSEETKKLMSLAQMGNKKMLGYKHTEESKKLMSERLKGKKRTPEMNEANRQRGLGRKMSEETKRKISEKLKGKVPSQKTIDSVIARNKARTGEKRPRNKSQLIINLN